MSFLRKDFSEDWDLTTGSGLEAFRAHCRRLEEIHARRKRVKVSSSSRLADLNAVLEKLELQVKEKQDVRLKRLRRRGGDLRNWRKSLGAEGGG